MKRVLFLRILALGAGFLLPAAGGAGDLPTGWSTNVFIPAAPGQLENRYALFLPAQYYATAKLWPLILFLHGSSDCGASPTLLYQRGPVDGTRNQGDFPCLVVSPICPRGAVWWDEQERPTLMALLDHIAAICRVDTNRIYLTGLSLGSLGAWDLCATYPERFAAVVPIAAAGNTARLDRIKDLPLWYFTGAKDSIGGAIYSEQMFKSLRALGSNARLTVYPDCDHDAWTATYRRVDLYDWLFRQRRQAAPAPLEADAESAAYIRAWQQRIAYYEALVKTAACARVTAPPALDGNLADPAWEKLPPLGGFRLPTGIAETKYPTEVRLAYDTNALYAAFTCMEPKLPGLVTNATRRNDPNLWQDDCVEIFLDPQLTRKTYYHLVATANGMLLGGIGRDGKWEATSVQAAAGRTMNAWTLELMIPWAELGMPAPAPGTRLGLQLCRTRAQRPSEVTQWSVTLLDHHVPERYGVLILH